MMLEALGDNLLPTESTPPPALEEANEPVLYTGEPCRLLSLRPTCCPDSDLHRKRSCPPGPCCPLLLVTQTPSTLSCPELTAFLALLIEPASRQAPSQYSFQVRKLRPCAWFSYGPILEGNPTFMCLVRANSGGWVRVNEFKTVVKVKRRKKETRGHSSPNLETFRSARVPLSH